LGINGFGRIGKLVSRQALTTEGIQLVHINDRMPPDMIAHLLKYDSLHGKLERDIGFGEGFISVDNQMITVSNGLLPSLIPWKEHYVDVVVDSSGKFKTAAALQGHIDGGAGKVILSCPAEDEAIKRTVVMGVNNHLVTSNDVIISNASCTTNCVAIMLQVLFEEYGVSRAFMNTVHPFTNNQNLQDGYHDDYRRARSALNNIIPTTTSAIEATQLVFPQLSGKFQGFASRVPVADCSFVELTAEINKKTTVEEINAAFLKHSQGVLKPYLEYTSDPVVSSDINRNRHSAVFDAQLTKVIDGDLIQIVAWYDNEAGYSARIIDLINYISK
jgi:glyceraldehyde 3-phosphate dehydrogenase